MQVFKKDIFQLEKCRFNFCLVKTREREKSPVSDRQKINVAMKLFGIKIKNNLKKEKNMEIG